MMWPLKRSLQKRNKDILIHFINDVLELHRSIKVIDVSFPNPTQLPDSKEEHITIHEKSISYDQCIQLD
jgi:hypothetical protein